MKGVRQGISLRAISCGPAGLLCLYYGLITPIILQSISSIVTHLDLSNVLLTLSIVYSIPLLYVISNT
jgi:hypothetical protein